MKLKMKLKKAETGNDFYQHHFDDMCEMLERGEGIWLYCWCTGHTRCAMVEASYEKALHKKYGERLVRVKDEDGWLEGFALS